MRRGGGREEIDRAVHLGVAIDRDIGRAEIAYDPGAGRHRNGVVAGEVAEQLSQDLGGIRVNPCLAHGAGGDDQRAADLERPDAGSLDDEIAGTLDAAFDARPRGHNRAGRGHGETVAGRRSAGNRRGRFVD